MQAHQPSSSDLTALVEQLEATLRAAASVSEALLSRVQALSERVAGLQGHTSAVRVAAEALRPFESGAAAPRPPDTTGAAVSGPAWPRPGPLGVLFVEVERSDGPLDLRAVDRPVSGHPGVADVALLDYDGRRARFKIWTRSAADVPELGAALEGSIRESLTAGQGGLVRVQVQASAA
jgi:hypothetical protein